MIPISADDSRLTSNSEAGDGNVVEGEDEPVVEDDDEETEALSGRRGVLLQCSRRRVQCWHGAAASHYELV